MERDEPFTCTTELGMKLVPVIEMVVAVADPAATVLGATEMIPGTGFDTGREAPADVPPPGAGFTAVRERLPPTATSATVTATLI